MSSSRIGLRRWRLPARIAIAATWQCRRGFRRAPRFWTTQHQKSVEAAFHVLWYVCWPANSRAQRRHVQVSADTPRFSLPATRRLGLSMAPLADWRDRSPRLLQPARRCREFLAKATRFSRGVIGNSGHTAGPSASQPASFSSAPLDFFFRAFAAAGHSCAEQIGSGQWLGLLRAQPVRCDRTKRTTHRTTVRSCGTLLHEGYTRYPIQPRHTGKEFRKRLIVRSIESVLASRRAARFASVSGLCEMA